VDALCRVMAEWTSSRSYEQRVHNLQTGVGTSPSDRVFLDERPDFDDQARDVLTGCGERDWFLLDLDGYWCSRDLVLDARKNEVRDDS